MSAFTVHTATGQVLSEHAYLEDANAAMRASVHAVEVRRVCDGAVMAYCRGPVRKEQVQCNDWRKARRKRWAA